MSIDINAFRSIAKQSPDKFVYAQGDTLKASHSDTSHGEHTYRAATEMQEHFEDAIRSRPQDFPFLTKYYLNAE